MARYFHISQGLRGAYMPDSAYIVKVNTRRELKVILQDEATCFRDAEFIGGSKRGVAWLAATQWRDTSNYLPYCLEFAHNHNRQNYAYGLFVSPASRAEYLEYLKESE